MCSCTHGVTSSLVKHLKLLLAGTLQLVFQPPRWQPLTPSARKSAAAAKRLCRDSGQWNPNWDFNNLSCDLHHLRSMLANTHGGTCMVMCFMQQLSASLSLWVKPGWNRWSNLMWWQKYPPKKLWRWSTSLFPLAGPLQASCAGRRPLGSSRAKITVITHPYKPCAQVKKEEGVRFWPHLSHQFTMLQWRVDNQNWNAPKLRKSPSPGCRIPNILEFTLRSLHWRGFQPLGSISFRLVK